MSYINGIDYTNFKNSVDDFKRHDVYMDLWTASHGLQAAEESDLLAELGIRFKGVERKE